MVLYNLRESECKEVSRGTADEPRPHALTGIGYGGQYATVFDPAYTGAIWLHTTYEVENGFADGYGILWEYTTKKFERLIQDYEWKVTTKKRKLPMLRPGDFIKFYPAHEDPEELPVITMERNEADELSIELGAKAPDYVDSYEVSTGSQIGFSRGILRESHESITDASDEFYANDLAHYTAPNGEMVFDIPANVKDTDLKPMITLDLSIDLKTEKTLVVGACAVELKTNEVYRRGGDFINWSPGVEIKEIDVTDWITAPGDYTPLYDGLAGGELVLGTWPTGGSKLIIEVSTESGHTDCDGTITIDNPDAVPHETLTIDGPGTYRSTTALASIPIISTADLDCHLKIIVTIPNTITVNVFMAEEYSETHGAYTDHPAFVANGTLKFWKRS